MNHERIPTRKLRSLRTAILGAVFSPLGAAGLVLAGSPAAQAAPVQEATQGVCRVHAVLASKEGDGAIPKNLEFMKPWLTDEPYDRYRSFHLLGTKKVSVNRTKASAVEFKTGHRMTLQLLGGSSSKLKLNLRLTHRDGKTSLGSTDYSIEDNGLFFVQGGEHKSGEVTGRILWAVQCARR